jgi:hypothetical protein
MRSFFIVSFLILAVSSLQAQKNIPKKWLDSEKKFLFYLQNEDFVKAEEQIQSMENFAFKKFKEQDSVFAATVLNRVQLSEKNKFYSEILTILEKHLKQVKALKQKNVKLNFRHYLYFVAYSNSCFALAESYMFNKKLPGEKIPEDNLTRFKKAADYYNSTISTVLELNELQNGHPFVKDMLSAAYRQKGRLEGQFMGNLNACIQSLERSISYKEDLETYRLLGVANGIAGKHFVAIDYFEKALKIGGNRQPAVLYALEVAYRQLSEIAQNTEEVEIYSSKADSYHIEWKIIDPNYDPNSGN